MSIEFHSSITIHIRPPAENETSSWKNHGKPVGFCSPDSLGPRFLCQVAPKTPLWKLRFSQRSNALRRTAALCWGAMGLRFLGLEIGEWFMFMILGHEMLCSVDLFWLLIIYIFGHRRVLYTVWISDMLIVACNLLVNHACAASSFKQSESTDLKRTEMRRPSFNDGCQNNIQWNLMSQLLKERNISTFSYEFPNLFYFIWCWERLWYAGSANRVIIVVVHLMSFLLRPGWREVVGVGLGISRPKRRWKTGRCTDGGKRCESTVVFEGWKRLNHWNQSSHGRFEVSKIPTLSIWSTTCMELLQCPSFEWICLLKPWHCKKRSVYQHYKHSDLSKEFDSTVFSYAAFFTGMCGKITIIPNPEKWIFWRGIPLLDHHLGYLGWPPADFCQICPGVLYSSPKMNKLLLLMMRC